MKLRLLSTLSFIMFFTSVVLSQTTVNEVYARNVLTNGINEIIPGAQVGNVTINESGATFNVGGTINLAGGTPMALSVTFSGNGSDNNAEITGTLNNVTIGKLLQAIGVSGSDLPNSFKNSRFNNLTLKLNPANKMLTASMATNLGQMEISGTKTKGYMIGIKPNNVGAMIGFQSINSALSGFTLIYSSHTKEENSSVNLLSNVKAKTGLNLYWTGQLPKPLRDFLAPANISGINNSKTFVCSESLTSQTSLPTLSFDLGGFGFSIVNFDGIALELNLSDASIGLVGDIRTKFGGGLPELNLRSSLVTKVSPAAMSGKVSFPGWDNAFGISGIDIKEIYLGSEASPVGAGTSLGGSATIFGLGGTVEVSSSNGVLGMSGEMDPIEIKSGGLTFFSLKGNQSGKGAAFKMNPSTKKGTFSGKVNLLGIESGSDVIIEPSKLSFTADGNLFGALKADLKLEAKNFTSFNASVFTLSGTIKQDLKSQIVNAVDISPALQVIVGTALSTLELRSIGVSATSTLANLERSRATLDVDIKMVGYNIPPISITVGINQLNDIPGIAEKIGKQVAKELEKVANSALDVFEDGAEAVYMGGKEAINWTGGAANTTYDWMDGFVGSAGKWFEGAGNDFVKLFGGGSDHKYDCPNEDFTPPNNGINSNAPIPRGIDQYRISVEHIKTLSTGSEGNNTLEVWGSILIKTNMAMQKNANPVIFNQSCRDAIACPLNTKVIDGVKQSKDFFIQSNLVSTSYFDIELDLYEEDPNKDEWFENKTLKIKYGNGMGLPSAHRKKRDHTVVIKDDIRNQEIEVKFSIERIPRFELIGIGTNNQLYTRKTVRSTWVKVPNSGSVTGITLMLDGTILGIGKDKHLYIRSLNSSWVKVPNSGDVIGITQLQNGTILAIGTDKQLYTRATLNSKWVRVPNSGDVIGITQLQNGTILAIGTDKQLYTRATLNSRWVKVPNSGDVIGITQLQNGTILAIGTDKQLYTRATLNSRWVKVYNSGSVIGVAALQIACYDGIKNQNEVKTDCGGSCIPCPTCNDGIRNQGEIDIDCGGPCSACATCSDGIKNQGETGTDCGGPNCNPCPTCNDGIQNQGETKVDCGGFNCNPCPTCNDGIQNQGETYTDCGGPNCNPCPTPPNAADFDKTTIVKLKNVETKRFVFSTGDYGEQEGGWLKSPDVVGSDANYYNRANWYLIKSGTGYLLRNQETYRYLFSTGDPVKGAEGGWLKSPDIVGSDANYYNRAIWDLIKQPNGSYLLKNRETKRYLFSAGEPVKAAEGGWLKSPAILGTDANYYNRALWTITGPGTKLLPK